MNIIGISALALPVLVACTFAEHSTTQVGQKVAEDLADVEDNKRPNPDFHLDNYQEFHDSNKHLRIPDDYLQQLLTEKMEKRASMRGFQGMRGKKNEYDMPAFYTGQFFDPAYNDIGYYYDKRALMGFQGMRGKKNIEEVLDELDKRSKMGFQGMRGKKSDEYEDRQPQVITEYRKRTPMGFQGMRGRKSSFFEQLDELEKRALLGFHGMRGKKDVSSELEEIPIDIDGYIEKRPMMMGFHGMRGKRNTNYYDGNRYEKRSSYHYFDNRGKKNPRWEILGKFVGVRGKKWTGSMKKIVPNSIYEELTEEH